MTDDLICADRRTYFGSMRCKFEPRYDYVGPDDVPQMRSSGSSVIEIIRALGQQTYVRDVCVRCGKTIERLK